MAGDTEGVESHDGNEQGQGRVETAGDTDNGRFRMGMNQPFSQPGYLYLEDFFATFFQCITGRDKRMRIDRTGQYLFI